MASRFWDISEKGVEELRTLQKELGSCGEELDQLWADLAGAAAECSEGLGIYAEAVNETVEAMSKLNEESKNRVNELSARMNRYIAAIEEELADASLE